MSTWSAAALSLVLPRCCAGCEAAVPSRFPQPLCAECEPAFGASAAPAPVHPRPIGMPPTWASGVYAGPLRSALLAVKERGREGLTPLLADLLQRAVHAAEPPWSCGPIVLVPVPSSRSSLRSRRADVVLQLARRVARVHAGRLRVLPALRHVRSVVDQAGLDTSQRSANLRGALGVRVAYVPRLAGAHVIVVDDVVTTGATLTEAARALALAGVPEVSAAVLAATHRRSRAHDTPGTHSALGRNSSK